MVYFVASFCVLEAQMAWDYHVATWNMQGAQGGGCGNSKWDTLRNVLQNSKSEISVMALQECGNQPMSARYLGLEYVTRINTSSSDRVESWRWIVGTTSRGQEYTIYRVVSRGLKAVGSRTTYAILTKLRPSEIILLRIEGEPRPVICIKITREWNADRTQVIHSERDRYYCSLHASAHRRNRAYETIGRLETEFHERRHITQRDSSWMIMADFNQEPQELQNALIRNDVELPMGFQREIISSGHFTHRGANEDADNDDDENEPTEPSELDYAVVGSSTENPVIQNIRVELDTELAYEQTHSDHTCVHFFPGH